MAGDVWYVCSCGWGRLVGFCVKHVVRVLLCGVRLMLVCVCLVGFN